MPNFGLSHVAGILDTQGGLRVVVTQNKKDFWRFHCGIGEHVIVVPGLLVQEPVPWNEIPPLIDKVYEYINKQVAPSNKCGGCMACCRTLYIKTDTFEKKSQTTCQHCTGHSCRIYAARPQPCRTFMCHWLKSQGGNDPMLPELRPDRCHVIFTDDTAEPDNWSKFECHVDNRFPEAAHEGVACEWVDRQQQEGRKAKLVTYYFGEGNST